MNSAIFNVCVAIIPVLGVIVTSFIVPFIKQKISADKLTEIIKWVDRAVRAAEIMFNVPSSGQQKHDYVVDFIDKTFNSKKEVITKQQIKILLEASVQVLNSSLPDVK